MKYETLNELMLFAFMYFVLVVRIDQTKAA